MNRLPVPIDVSTIFVNKLVNTLSLHKISTLKICQPRDIHTYNKFTSYILRQGNRSGKKNKEKVKKNTDLALPSRGINTLPQAHATIDSC